MDANEQAQADATAAEATQQQTTVTDATGSEAAKNTAEETDKGDLRIALQQERDKRRDIEARLNDPNFVYAKAKELGLATEEEEDDATASKKPELKQPPVNVDTAVQFALRKEKALDKYPDLRTDDTLGTMVTALMAKGMDPVEAADEVFGRIGKAAKVEETAQAEASTVEKATTVTSTVRTNSAAEVMEDRRKRMNSPDSDVREQAYFEALKDENKKAGIF